MKKYRCVIWSDSSYQRDYIAHTTSAYKSAMMLGRCEGGEVVEVRRVMSDVVLSRVVWTAGQYIRSAD